MLLREGFFIGDTFARLPYKAREAAGYKWLVKENSRGLKPLASSRIGILPLFGSQIPDTPKTAERGEGTLGRTWWMHQQETIAW